MSWRKGFTLIEVLLVITIIVILAGILVPYIQDMMHRARETQCQNRMSVIYTALKDYELTYNEYPLWIAQLHSLGLTNADPEELFVCPFDQTKGADGGKPDHPSNDQHIGPDYDGTYEGGTIDYGALTSSSQDAFKCSYLYEDNMFFCDWADNNSPYKDDNFPQGAPDGKKDADFNRDGKISWKEAKRAERYGVQSGVAIDPPYGYGDQIPILRCFWHGDNKLLQDNEKIVFNIRYGGTFYDDGWVGSWVWDIEGKP